MAFLEPRLDEAYRVLAPHGSFYLHVDYREVHRCRFHARRLVRAGQSPERDHLGLRLRGAAEDALAGEARQHPLLRKERVRLRLQRGRDRAHPLTWPQGWFGPEKAARGKLPTDTWWHTIVPTRGAERTGYPTQKPLGILRRIVTASSRPGDVVLDFFAGSGTTGMAAHELDRRFILVDNNPEALEVMAKRFEGVPGVRWEGFDPLAPTPAASTVPAGTREGD